MNIYEELGFKDRDDYLNSLAEAYGIPIKEVKMLADTIGPDEDFDGLVVMLEDHWD